MNTGFYYITICHSNFGLEFIDKFCMQLLPIWDMQQAGCDTTDEGCDANNDDEASKTNSSEAKLIDCGDILPRYHDISPLGCGAKAIIFSAIDQNCQKRIAVKKVGLKTL